MTDTLAYPAIIQEGAGEMIGRFVDIPEAITSGRDRATVAANLYDALAAAVSKYLELGRSVPRPSKATPGTPFILLDPRLAPLAVAQFPAIPEPIMTDQVSPNTAMRAKALEAALRLAVPADTPQEVVTGAAIFLAFLEGKSASPSQG